jgi:RNA polymerase sigma-70 factor (ECF subfamily)
VAPLPDEAFERNLHRRLVDGDPVAPAVLAMTYLVPVVERLRASSPGVGDDMLIQDAATDAILNYAERPKQFDPAKSKLFPYLVMAARGDLRNALAKRRRRERREVLHDRVEDLSLVRNIEQEESEPALATGETVSLEEVRRAVQAVITNPTDWRLVELMLDGERRTEVFAKVLGIAHLADEQQRRMVKRHKDRLKRRLERLGVKLRG